MQSTITSCQLIEGSRTDHRQGPEHVIKRREINCAMITVLRHNQSTYQYRPTSTRRFCRTTTMLRSVLPPSPISPARMAEGRGRFDGVSQTIHPATSRGNLMKGCAVKAESELRQYSMRTVWRGNMTVSVSWSSKRIYIWGLNTHGKYFHIYIFGQGRSVRW